MKQRLRAGTRRSTLARRQTAGMIRKIQEGYPHLEIEEVFFSTKGDRDRKTPLPQIGEKGLFTQELERALLNGEIDFAVHSLKDLPTEPAPGLKLGAVPPRGNPLDALVTRDNRDLADLTYGERVGTSSLRRAAQIRYLRPDLVICDLRGNLDTRIRKLEQGLFDAVILAAAGLTRLGWMKQDYCLLAPEICLPAPGQGALAVEIRSDDNLMQKICENVLEDPASRQAVTAERAFLQALGGGCQVPLGALAVIADGHLRLRGLIAREDGARVLRDEIWGFPEQAFIIGEKLAASMIEKGAKEIMACEI